MRALGKKRLKLSRQPLRVESRDKYRARIRIGKFTNRRGGATRECRLLNLSMRWTKIPAISMPSSPNSSAKGSTAPLGSQIATGELSAKARSSSCAGPRRTRMGQRLVEGVASGGVIEGLDPQYHPEPILHASSPEQARRLRFGRRAHGGSARYRESGGRATADCDQIQSHHGLRLPTQCPNAQTPKPQTGWSAQR